MLASPVFPFLAPGTLEPWLAALYGSPVIPESVDPQTLTALSQVRAPFNLLDAFFAPWQLTVEAEGARYFLSPILLGFPLWFLVRRSDAVNWLAFPAIFYLIAIIVPLPSTNLRYLIAAVPALTLVVAHAFVQLSRLRPRLAGLVIAFFVVVGLYRVPGVVISRLTRTQAVPYVLGQSSANEYLDTHFDTGVRRLMAVARWADTVSDPHAKILMLFDARGYYFTRDVFQDIRVSNWPLLAQSPGVEGCLEGTDITHVLVAIGVVNYYALRGLSLHAIRWDQFESFRERCLEPALDVGGFVVFAVRPREG